VARFAVFYNPADLLPIELEALRLDMSLADRRLAADIWAGGLKDWRVAPIASVERQEGDVETRIVVIDAPGRNLAEFVDFLRRRAVATGNALLRKLGDDMSRSSGGVEPWP
jgi:hypothetical protein